MLSHVIIITDTKTNHMTLEKIQICVRETDMLIKNHKINIWQAS